MNVVILGAGPEERAWADALAAIPSHRLVAAFPGLPGSPELPGRGDLDAALAVVGLEAAIVGGDDELRAEGLRRAAGAGLACVVLHPPGPDALPYDQVALSRFETGAVVVPDLPGRLHPLLRSEGLILAVAGRNPNVGAFQELRYERVVGPDEGGLRSHAFARAVDLVRALLGEVAQVNATGDPPGKADPTSGLVVQLRDESGRRAEVRLRSGAAPGGGRLEVVGARGVIRLDHTPDWRGPDRLQVEEPESVEVVTSWDRHAAILDALAAAASGRPASPALDDGTRAMEAAGAVARSLRRGRTVDLHHEQASEAGNFKAIMTSVGCLLLVGSLLVLLVALAGPALGVPGTIYLAYLIPPALVLFAVAQLLRLGIRDVPPPAPRVGEEAPEATRADEASNTGQGPRPESP